MLKAVHFGEFWQAEDSHFCDITFRWQTSWLT